MAPTLGFALPRTVAGFGPAAVCEPPMTFDRARRRAAPAAEAPRSPMDFLRHIDAAERWLLHYWWSKRIGDAAPRRAAIDPIEMVKLLPNLQIHARTNEGRLLCRLSGTAVVNAMHVDTTGRHLDEAISPEAYASRKRFFDLVLDSGRPLLYRARMTFVGQEWRSYRRFMLPLHYRSATPDMILSLVQFEQASVAEVAAGKVTIDVIDHRGMSDADLAIFAELFTAEAWRPH